MPWPRGSIAKFKWSNRWLVDFEIESILRQLFISIVVAWIFILVPSLILYNRPQYVGVTHPEG